jgi:hypothetical protein
MTNENSTENMASRVHEGVTYRKVNRKASVGEKVLITESDDFKVGTITECEELCDKYYGKDGSIKVSEYVSDFVKGYIDCSTESYVVLEPVEQSQDTLTLTEADVRNNPRQVIDMFTSLALKQTQLEAKVERLASANEQAITTVARNVETWAQEVELTKEAHEGLKRKVADLDTRTQPYQQAHELFVKIASGMNGRDLTAEERREL